MADLSQDERVQVANEVKEFAATLSLSPDQKEKLHKYLVDARERLQEYMHQNPSASKADAIKKGATSRDALRERLVGFLSTEQLKRWDAEVAKAKEFLGHRIAA